MTLGFNTGPAGGADSCLRLMIGDVNITLRSDLRDLLDEVAELYPNASDASDAPAASQTIQMEIRQTRSRLGGRRYRVYGNGQEIGGEKRRNEVFPFLEWGINLCVIATRSQYVQLHAASMAHCGNGFIFAGSSGSGKSTVAAGLMARGWNYLCDEFALIDRNTLCLEPFPKPLCIKAGSFPVIKRLGLPFARRRDYIKSQKGRVGYINPNDVEGHPVARSVPIRFVIFPKYTEKQPPRLYPISRTRALMDLAGCVFNRHAFDDQGLSVLTKVIRHAECFRLQTGNIRATCDLLEAQLCHPPALRLRNGTPTSRVIARSPDGSGKAGGPLLARRSMLKRSARLAYVVPTVMTLTAQKAFASGNPSSNPSCVATGDLCETDTDCCSADCDHGVCE